MKTLIVSNSCQIIGKLCFRPPYVQYISWLTKDFHCGNVSMSSDTVQVSGVPIMKIQKFH